MDVHIATCTRTRMYVGIHCITLHYITLQYSTVPYRTVPYSTVPYRTEYITSHCITVQYVTLHCITSKDNEGLLASLGPLFGAYWEYPCSA